MQVQVSAEARGGCQVPRAKVRDGCQLPEVGAGNPTWGLWKHSKSPAHKQVYLNSNFYITTDSEKNQLLQLRNCCCDVALILYEYYTLR